MADPAAGLPEQIAVVAGGGEAVLQQQVAQPAQMANPAEGVPQENALKRPADEDVGEPDAKRLHMEQQPAIING